MKKRFPNADARPLEIDYDKLAEAIVKAQTKVEKPAKKANKYRNILYWGINDFFYYTVFLLLIFGICYLWKGFVYNGILLLIAKILFSMTLLIFAIISLLARKEATEDRNRNAREYFAANMSFVAVLVALFALFKEVIF